MKTPDEIKKELGDIGCCGLCPEYGCTYDKQYRCINCEEQIDAASNALEYIQQLENQIGELTEKVKQLEAAQPKWISVDERLPDNRGNFITKIHCDNGDWIEVNTFDHTEKEWWHDAGNRTVEATEFVTHWMPIPEQQKEDA